jgi:hypothetical protein
MQAMQATPSRERIAEAEAELRKVRDDWLGRPGVTAVDVGFRYRDGRRTDEIAVRVHVRSREAVERLPAAQHFPEQLGSVPVDIIEATYGLERG